MMVTKSQYERKHRKSCVSCNGMVAKKYTKNVLLCVRCSKAYRLGYQKGYHTGLNTRKKPEVLMMKKQHLKGNLYASDFFYELEKDGEAEYYSKKEIVSAIKKAVNENLNSASQTKR